MTIRRYTIQDDNLHTYKCEVILSDVFYRKNCILNLRIISESEFISANGLNNAWLTNSNGLFTTNVHLLQKISLRFEIANDYPTKYVSKINKENILRYNMNKPNVEMCEEWITLHKRELFKK